MTTRNVFWGTLLLTAGVLFLARNAGWLGDIDWHTVVQFWPVLLILAGIRIILDRQNSPWASVPAVLLAVSLAFVGVGVLSRNHWHDGRYSWRYNDNDDEGRDEAEDEDNDEGDNEESYNEERSERRMETRSDVFKEAMTPDTRAAVLKLEGGAARFAIGAPVADLISAQTRMTLGSYKMEVSRDATTKTPTIELTPNEGRIKFEDGEIDNRVDVALNAAPVWNVEVDMGAGAGDFDLTSYNVKALDLEAGAAEVDLKLGDRADVADVKVSSGVASVVIRVPKGVGCRIDHDGAFNVNELDDFEKDASGDYVSPGYASAKKKINIKYEGGMSRFKVVRY